DLKGFYQNIPSDQLTKSKQITNKQNLNSIWFFALAFFFLLFTFSLFDTAFASQRLKGGDHPSIGSCSKVYPNGAPSKEAMAEETEEEKDDSEEAIAAVPPRFDEPTLVDLGLYIVEVTEVDPIANTFKIEAFMDLVWCDPRLVSKDKPPKEIEYLEEDAADKLKEIWWPDVGIVNASGGREIENEELIIYPDGTVEYREKFSALMEAHYDLIQFPFDKQHLEIEMESFAWDYKIVKYHAHKSKIGFSAEFKIPEWEIDNVKSKVEDVKEIRDRSAFSEFLLDIEVDRISGFYLWKVILPLMILVMVSWSIFWMSGDSLADRMSVSLTGILTIVAYQFLISEILPRVPYFTFMDAILMLSFGLIALTILVNIIINISDLGGNDSTSLSIDRACRVLFPAFYFGALAIMAVVYLPESFLGWTH
ncbi:MAG: hypothetical protein QNL04_09415, partial [SAR324 cluster bacterium]|nr:hypothetical protein [SAR324 cluster bacterium]